MKNTKAKPSTAVTFVPLSGDLPSAAEHDAEQDNCREPQPDEMPQAPLARLSLCPSSSQLWVTGEMLAIGHPLR